VYAVNQLQNASTSDEESASNSVSCVAYDGRTGEPRESHMRRVRPAEKEKAESTAATPVRGTRQPSARTQNPHSAHDAPRTHARDTDGRTATADDGRRATSDGERRATTTSDDDERFGRRRGGGEAPRIRNDVIYYVPSYLREYLEWALRRDLRRNNEHDRFAGP